jgi:hypothetical protein
MKGNRLWTRAELEEVLHPKTSKARIAEIERTAVERGKKHFGK